MKEAVDLDDDLITNPLPRCACVLLLDTSGSMEGAPIESLYAGVKQFLLELGANDMARHSVEVAIVTFGGVPEVVLDFKLFEQIRVPSLYAGGPTPIGPAVDLALKLLGERLSQYRLKGIGRHRPLIILMTDGQPTDLAGNKTDDYKPAAAKLRTGAARQHKDPAGINVCCVAIGDEANIAILSEFCPPDSPPIRISPGDFGKLFHWFSVFLGKVANSVPGTATPMGDF